MAKRYVPWTARFSRSRSIATYLKRAIDADIITQQGEVEAVDSAQVEGIVQASAVDSAEVTNLISSDYIQARVDGTYIRDYIDQEYVRSLLDSAYISGLAGGGAAPTITAVSPTSYNGTSGSTITVNGSNFTVGTYVDFIDINGAEYRASSTTLVSQAQVTAVTPQGFSANVDPLSVKVTTLYGTTTASNVITTGSSPSWSTGTNLGSYSKNSPVDLTVVATDPQSQPVTYQVKSGSSLPTGLSLNSNTGNITGTLNYSISSNTSVSTIITASDTTSNTTDRTFNWTITPTSNISQTVTLPALGDQYYGPTTGTNGEMQTWFEQNVKNNAWFDQLFDGVGSDVHNSSDYQGIWWFNPKVNLRVDYDVRGARGGDNYQYSSYGKGRKITGSFYLHANAILWAWVGRYGEQYTGSGFKYSAGAGGGCSGIAIMRAGSFQAGYMYPVVIAAGGAGTPGGNLSSNISNYPDVYSALPLDFPYRTDTVTGGRYTRGTTDVGQYGANNSNYPLGYVAGGAGWLDGGGQYTSSNSPAYLGTYQGRAALPWKNYFQSQTTTVYGNNYTWYDLRGGFGGGGGTWYQTQSASTSTDTRYHKYGGGAGGYYGGYPTSSALIGSNSSLTGSLNGTRLYQYPYASDWNPGVTNGRFVGDGLNNDYYGAYSYALGLESTGSYTYDGGSVDGTAPSAGAITAYSTNGGAWWNSTLPRPTDHGLNPSIDGYVRMVFSPA